VIVRLDADGVVVTDADDCAGVHVRTALDADGLRTALQATDTGTPAGPGGRDEVVLDVAVLRSRARLVASEPDWDRRFAAMVAAAGDRLTDDGLGLRVPVERN
jgi:hypothetical protein